MVTLLCPDSAALTGTQVFLPARVKTKKGPAFPGQICQMASLESNLESASGKGKVKLIWGTHETGDRPKVIATQSRSILCLEQLARVLPGRPGQARWHHVWCPQRSPYFGPTPVESCPWCTILDIFYALLSFYMHRQTNIASLYGKQGLLLSHAPSHTHTWQPCFWVSVDSTARLGTIQIHA